MNKPFLLELKGNHPRRLNLREQLCVNECTRVSNTRDGLLFAYLALVARLGAGEVRNLLKNVRSVHDLRARGREKTYTTGWGVGPCSCLSSKRTSCWFMFPLSSLSMFEC